GALPRIPPALVLLRILRPLLFLSVDPEVAVARGVPSRALSALFFVLVAVTVAESVQAVGALLIFGLMVTPAAVAQNLSTRPWVGMALSAGIAVAVGWLGLVVAIQLAFPASLLDTRLACLLS